MKQEKTICKSVEQYGGDWPPEDAAGFVAWFQDKLEDIPEAYRNTARIELDSTSYLDDSSHATIDFRYERPETDEEEAEREQAAMSLAERRRTQELRTLAELQAKYGNPGA